MELNGCFFTYQKMFFVSNIGLLMHIYIDTNLCELFYTPTSGYTTQYKGTLFKGLCEYQHPGFRLYTSQIITNTWTQGLCNTVYTFETVASPSVVYQLQPLWLDWLSRFSWWPTFYHSSWRPQTTCLWLRIFYQSMDLSHSLSGPHSHTVGWDTCVCVVIHHVTFPLLALQVSSSVDHKQSPTPDNGEEVCGNFLHLSSCLFMCIRVNVYIPRHII